MAAAHFHSQRTWRRRSKRLRLSVRHCARQPAFGAPARSPRMNQHPRCSANALRGILGPIAARRHLRIPTATATLQRSGSTWLASWTGADSGTLWTCLGRAGCSIRKNSHRTSGAPERITRSLKMGIHRSLRPTSVCQPYSFEISSSTSHPASTMCSGTVTGPSRSDWKRCRYGTHLQTTLWWTSS